MTKKIDIGILGADGRMGQAVMRSLETDLHLRLTVAITSDDSPNLGKDAHKVANLRPVGLMLSSNISEGLDLCDVLIDFSHPEATLNVLSLMKQSRCNTLITGTTGYSKKQEKEFRVGAKGHTVLQSGNFSPGINILQALVKIASEKLNDKWDIEILEMHHNKKKDAPSGTALMLGSAAADGRKVKLEEKISTSRASHSKARKKEEIGFAVLRGGGVIGQHEVRIANDQEMITLKHDAFDRDIFAKGAVNAAVWAHNKEPGIYSMKDVLNIDP
jgi:4-hydroxy-tetrahydrodipicolinate reductase